MLFIITQLLRFTAIHSELDVTKNVTAPSFAGLKRALLGIPALALHSVHSVRCWSKWGKRVGQQVLWRPFSTDVKVQIVISVQKIERDCCFTIWNKNYVEMISSFKNMNTIRFYEIFKFCFALEVLKIFYVFCEAFVQLLMIYPMMCRLSKSDS